MQVITSKENKIYKMCKALAMKKYRDELALYIVEGKKTVKEACDARLAEMVVVSESYARECEIFFEQTVVLSDALFQKLTQTVTSQGILAIASKKAYNEEAFTNAIMAQEGEASNIVVLDKLQDPGNIGTIIRTADAAGFGGLVAIKGTGDIFSPKVIRACAGSIFRLPIFFAKSEKQAVSLVRGANKKIVTTALDADKYYFDEDLSNNTALVFGNEGNGISKEMREYSDTCIKIPMNKKVDSLNVAVAAGILIYQTKAYQVKGRVR